MQVSVQYQRVRGNPNRCSRGGKLLSGGRQPSNPCEAVRRRSSPPTKWRNSCVHALALPEAQARSRPVAAPHRRISNASDPIEGQNATHAPPRAPHETSPHVARRLCPQPRTCAPCSAIMRASLKGGMYTPPVLPAATSRGRRKTGTIAETPVHGQCRAPWLLLRLCCCPAPHTTCAAAPQGRLHAPLRQLQRTSRSAHFPEVFGNAQCRRLTQGNGLPCNRLSALRASSGARVHRTAVRRGVGGIGRGLAPRLIRLVVSPPARAVASAAVSARL